MVHSPKTGRGIPSAKRRSLHFGVKMQDVPDRLDEYYARWCEGTTFIRTRASELGISKSTFYKRYLRLKKKENCLADCVGP